jgi:flavodoxin
MRAAVVYETMRGNTAAIAEAIGRGLRSTGMDATVTSFDGFAPSKVVDLDLLVVGAPTQSHGLGRDAGDDTTAEEEQRVFEGSAPEPDIREWLEDLPDGAGRAAVAFDTRRHGPKFLTGSAARTIESKLEFGGFQIAGEPESFLVTKDERLDDGEEARAEAWAADLGAVLTQVLQREEPS